MNPVYVVPIGEVDPPVVDWIGACIAAELHLWTVRLEAIPEPDGAYDASRGQYSSVEMMRELSRIKPADALRLLGITGRDLFIPMLSFVFGQAQLNGPLSLISLARLHQEFYGLPRDPLTLRARARIEALHELGHSFGLIHCRDSGCAMSLSTTIAHVDAKANGYCGSCSKLVSQRTASYRR